MNGKTSIAGMFAQGADGITDDMDRIVGRVSSDLAAKLAQLTDKEYQEMYLLDVNRGRGRGWTREQSDRFNELKKRYVANGGTFPLLHQETPQPQPEPEPQPVSGNILDFSSPLNTIVKSLFFLSLSPMFAGTHHFYIISVGCTGAIIYSLFKQFNR